MDQSRINVLIVDDDLDLLRICSTYLNLADINVVGTATDGYKAIEMLKNSIPKPDVIVIDYHMPKMNGIETSKKIIKSDNSYKIIMISARSSIKQRALSNGIHEFIEKPFNLQKLCEKIKLVARN